MVRRRRTVQKDQPAIWEGRVIAWFSCGAASLAMSKLTIDKYGDRCVVANCDMRKDEHEDNERVFRDAEKWLGRTIIRLKSLRYSSVDEVFEKERYMSGVEGARRNRKSLADLTARHP